MMTGPDCVVRCNLINTHTHTHVDHTCVCVFLKLHITAQSSPVIYSFYATVFVCVFIKLNITA